MARHTLEEYKSVIANKFNLTYRQCTFDWASVSLLYESEAVGLFAKQYECLLTQFRSSNKSQKEQCVDMTNVAWRMLLLRDRRNGSV